MWANGSRLIPESLFGDTECNFLGAFVKVGEVQLSEFLNLLASQLFQVYPVVVLDQNDQEVLRHHAYDVASTVEDWEHAVRLLQDVVQVVDAHDTLDGQH